MKNLKTFWYFKVFSLIFLLALFIFSFKFIVPVFAPIIPGLGPYTGPQGNLVPAWVNLSRGDMFFANGDHVFIVANFSCSGLSVCNESLITSANFSQIGGSENVPGVFKYNSTNGKKWAIFEFNDTINTNNIDQISPRNISINATAADDETLSNFIVASVMLVNMSTLGCPPETPIEGFPTVPGYNISSGTPAGPEKALACTQNSTLCANVDYYGPGAWDDVSNQWEICAPIFGGASTNLTEIASTGNFSAIPNFTIEVPDGKIVFNQNVSFATQQQAQAIMQFAMKSIMSGGKIGLNDSEYCGEACGRSDMPNLNLSATLTIYNVSRYGVNGRPQIYRYPYGSTNGTACPSGICSDFDWDGENITFTVTSFSDYGLSDAINVTLVSPTDYGYSNLLNTNFTFIPDWSTSVTMNNCTLYGNFTGVWTANATNQSTLTNGVVNGINNTVSGNGSYAWNVYCYDTTGQYDYYSPNWTVIVDTTLKPKWFNNSTSPTSPTIYSLGIPYWFNITVTDAGSAVSKVLLEFNGTNYTTTQEGNVYYKIFTDLPAKTGGYSYKWFMNNSAGNWNSTDSYSYVINKIPTSITLYLNDTVWTTDASMIYPNITKVNATIDVSSLQPSVVLQRNISSVSNPETVLLGASVYNYTGSFAGNENYTGSNTTKILTISPTAPSLSLIISPSNSATYLTTTTATGTLVSGDTIANITLYRNSTIVSTSTTLTSLIETILLGAGGYNYTFVYNGTQNYTFSSLTNITSISRADPSSYINLYIDNQTNDKTITYPATAEIRGNLSTIQGANDLTFNLYRNSTKIGSGNVINQTVDSTRLGNNTYTFVYNTTGGANWTSGSAIGRILYVLKGPTLTRLFLNQTEGNKTYILNQSANFTVTLNVSGKTVHLQANLTGWALQNGTTPLTNYTNLTQGGVFNITGYFTEDENYTSSSQTYYLVVDIIPPSWSSQTQNASTLLVGDGINLSVQWADDYGLSYAILSTNETGSWLNKTTYSSPSAITGTSNTSSFAWQNSSVTKGTGVGWKVYVNDTSNNWNVTDAMVFTLKGSDGTSCSAAIECLGGYCVHGYCRSSAWYAGDGYCDSTLGESCSSSSSDCGACPSSAPGGVSSPTSATTPGKAVIYIPSISANNEADIIITKTEGIEFSEIDITAKNKVVSVYLTVTKLDTKPDEVPAITNVYHYVNVVKENIEDADVSKAEIKFKVEKSWISANNIDPDAISLYRFAGGKWNKLTTTKLSEDSSYIYYVAETPGFSYFAISGETKKQNCPYDCCVGETVYNDKACASDYKCENRTCSKITINCTEDWSCSGWSDCVDGKQSRTCSDSNNCGTVVNKPAETQTCGGSEEAPTNGIAVSWEIVLIISLIIVVIVIVVLFEKKIKPTNHQ